MCAIAFVCFLLATINEQYELWRKSERSSVYSRIQMLTILFETLRFIFWHIPCKSDQNVGYSFFVLLFGLFVPRAIDGGLTETIDISVFIRFQLIFFIEWWQRQEFGSFNIEEIIISYFYAFNHIKDQIWYRLPLFFSVTWHLCITMVMNIFTAKKMLRDILNSRYPEWYHILRW